MLFKKLFFTLLLVTTCFMHPIAPPPGFNPNMSEEELLNQLMEEINAALPADQRDAFWEEVARETERLERETAHMSEDEKLEYLGGLINEEMKPVEPARPQEKPKPIVKDVQKEKPRQVIPMAKTEEIMQLISQLVKSIESFISKAAAFPDFDGKALNWIQKGRITDWQAESWSGFIHELNKFIHTLQRFKEKDAKIGFKHLEAIASKEALIQNLKQLQKKLSDYESAISISSFEIASMSEQTKNSAINTINALTDAIYRTKLAQELQKVLEEFDPTAKKIREEEEKAYQKAFDLSKKPQPRASSSIVGKPAKDSFALPKLEDLGFSGRPSRSGTGGGAAGKQASQSDQKRAASKGGGAAGAKGGKGAAGKKEGEKGKGGEAKKEDEKKKPAPAQLQHAEIKKNVEEGLRRDIEEVWTALNETQEFQSADELKKYVRKPAPTPTAPAAAGV